ncbi:helix-turn-helix domain-containing protein [Leclercia adecarboxylata]|uniref:phage repressor protein CI n=1 Tax=Enterobacteriaceae TaxID=543 RepID=UPI000907ED8C|nr:MULTISPECIES: phage repressor protein CI [Enterobacteriaceae]MDV5318633.1 phage repressor protein CI [Enterobacter roggenkampii]MDV5328580.1 phage repressor protein CI [Enterobacter roggenkampii]MDV5679571.1 phage repressor protein CI [Enterobacter roggenkampii]MEB5749154.1 helix-turn-helix domain-containing protein [Leclercia adecarboxylata]
MSTSKYPNEIKINPNQGGKAAIERLVKAYGFTTRQALADHLGVSKSTLANRYMRDTFPADWIIQCALETGVSLRWLSTSDGPMRLDARTQVASLNKTKIIDGKLIDSGYILFDTTLLPCNVENISAVEYENSTYLIRQDVNEVNDGKWMVSIDGLYSIRELARLPNNRIMLESKSSKIECNIEDIEVIGKVILTCK